MLEPLLHVVIPTDTVIPGKYRSAGDTAEKVLVLQQTFDNVQAQEYLAAVCRSCAVQAGVRLIAVEGSDGEIQPSGGRRSVRDLIRSGSAVSAGVLSLQDEDETLIDVWGVDDMTANRASQAAMAEVIGAGLARDGAIAALRPLVAAAQLRVYPPRVARLRSGTLSLAGSRLKLTEQAALLQQTAADAGIQVSDFPLVGRFNEISEQERRTSNWRVKAQMAKFVLRVRKRAYGWFTRAGRNQLTVDLEKAKPVLEYWMEMTGMTAAELDQVAERQGMEQALLLLKKGLDDWLIARAKTMAAQAGGAGMHAYYEDLMRFALRVGVPFFDLKVFRQYVAMLRDLETLKHGLPAEMVEASRRVAGATAEGRELRDLEDELDLLHRALRLEVPPGEADAEKVAPDRLKVVAERLARLAGTALPAEVARRLDGLVPAARAAARFLELSRQRSRHMANRTLELLRERGEDRAVLVAGGFHERAITRAFDDSDVSWSVVAPKPDLAELRRGAGSIMMGSGS